MSSAAQTMDVSTRHIISHESLIADRKKEELTATHMGVSYATAVEKEKVMTPYKRMTVMSQPRKEVSVAVEMKLIIYESKIESSSMTSLKNDDIMPRKATKKKEVAAELEKGMTTAEDEASEE